MYIQLLSDIHLEMDHGDTPYYTFDFPVCAPNLALLGDIGLSRDDQLFEWLDIQLSRFERVFYVFGNHESYHSSIPETISALEAFEVQAASLRESDKSRGEFIFLNRKRYDVGPNLTILGCTLWSAINPENLDYIFEFLNDFHVIRNFNPTEYQAIHEADLSWLSVTIEDIRKEGSSRKVVVFSHHAPTVEGTSDPKFFGSPGNSAFSTELTKLPLWDSPLVVWAFGHTHHSCDFIRRGVRVVGNQRGYYGESTGFVENKVLSIVI